MVSMLYLGLFFWLIVFKLCIRVDFLEEWFEIVDRLISSNKRTAIALDLCKKNGFNALSLGIFWLIVGKTLYTS